MARAVKKELSLEEKLAAALVPEEEQPYKVPENWCWVRLGSLYKVNPKNEAPDNIDAAFVPMEKVSADMSQSFEYVVQPWIKAKKGHTQFADGDVAFAKISPCFENRKSMIVEGLPNGIGGGTTELVILRQPMVNQHFTFWLVSTEDFIQGGSQTYSGTVGQQRISMDYVRNYPVPLPPLSEQQRIVTLIESLFTDLDEAKEKLTAVVEGFAQRKAAILHQAFTGELTAKWREENGVTLDSWGKLVFDDCIDKMQNGLSKRNGSEGEDYAVLRLANIGENDIDTGDLRYIMLNDKEQSKYELYDGDVLMIRVNGSRDNVGRQIYVNNPRKWAFCDHLIRICYKDFVSARYMCFFANTHKYRRYIEDNMVSSAGQNTISRKGMQELIVDVPSVLEQQEIVRLLDEIFEQEQQAQSSVESVLADIDTIKKSILARAFRGELGTNDPTEEHAAEMLKRVL